MVFCYSTTLSFAYPVHFKWMINCDFLLHSFLLWTALVLSLWTRFVMCRTPHALQMVQRNYPCDRYLGNDLAICYSLPLSTVLGTQACPGVVVLFKCISARSLTSIPQSVFIMPSFRGSVFIMPSFSGRFIIPAFSGSLSCRMSTIA